MTLRVLQVRSHRNFASAIGAHRKRFGEMVFKSSYVGQCLLMTFEREVPKLSASSPGKRASQNPARVLFRLI
jgi:hypothetical protein